ncbi:MAG: (Fe-S)-binding protein [Pseudomonadota bacterium]
MTGTGQIKRTDLAEIARSTKAWACYDCGKCTATCPLTRAGAPYSPRRQVLATNLGQRDELISGGALFTCLTCGLCDSRCPSGVEFSDLVRKLRELGRAEGAVPDCPHGGALQSVMRMMAAGGARQNRLEWVTDDLKVQEKEGSVYFFAGCTMYLDAYFPELGVTTLNGTRAAIKVLNRLGVEPVVSREERCCGHDLLWTGDRENFERLARHNVELFARSGATTLVAPCAECLRTWKIDYAPYFQGPLPKTLHFTEYLAGNLEGLEFKGGAARKVTFQDPCRLGRQLGIYDAPRTVIAALPETELVEMRHSRKNSTCCAGGPWSSCDRHAKEVQTRRLREARTTGAEVLVTSCPKCQVHFKCTMQDPLLHDEITMEMRDIAELVMDALDGHREHRDGPDRNRGEGSQ